MIVSCRLSRLVGIIGSTGGGVGEMVCSESRAVDGLPVSSWSGPIDEPASAWSCVARGEAPVGGSSLSWTSATKRKPLRVMVRINRCSMPLSPIAERAALMRLDNVDSDTIRPRQTAVSRSCLLTTRSRFLTRQTRTSKTCGSTATSCPPRLSSRRSTSIEQQSKMNT